VVKRVTISHKQKKRLGEENEFKWERKNGKEQIRAVESF